MHRKLGNWILHPYKSLWSLCDYLVWNVLHKPSERKIMSDIPPIVPETVEAYENHFRNNLHGTWDTAINCVCPDDIWLKFDESGTGSYSLGMYQGGGEFLWKQTGEFTIGVRKNEGEAWIRVDYLFYKLDSGMNMHLWPADEAPEWVNEFTWDWLPLSGI